MVLEQWPLNGAGVLSRDATAGGPNSAVQNSNSPSYELGNGIGVNAVSLALLACIIYFKLRERKATHKAGRSRCAA